MIKWNIVFWGAVGSAATILIRMLFVALVTDFARRFSLSIIGVRIFDFLTRWFLSDPIWSGQWKITWQVSSSSFKQENSYEGKIYRCLDTVVTEGMGHTADGESIPYGFVGKLSRDHTILTGIWFDRRGAKSGYHGSYQIRLSAGGSTLASGKWIGFSEQRNTVKAGKLTWQKLRT
jgi:hypothetical protein